MIRPLFSSICHDAPLLIRTTLICGFLALAVAGNSQLNGHRNRLNAESDTLPNSVELTPMKVVSEFLRAFQERDHHKIIQLMHPDVEWIQPGNNRVSGIKKSVSEILAMSTLMSDLSANTLKLAEIKIFSENGSSVACLMRCVAAQPIGRVLDVENIGVYMVEGSKIKKVVIHSSDVTQEDKFWGNH